MKNFVFLFLMLLVVKNLVAGDIDSISVYSEVMKKPIPCVVIKPSRYKKSKTRFPVVYLLHGYGGSQRQWITLAPQLKTKADDLQIMIVCPDGGIGSWYLDSPIDSTFKYETFVSRELVGYIDSKYKTRADKSSRAITGLSMGGHGGLFLSIRHSDIYAQGGSTSGGVDIRPFTNNWDLKKRLGDTICCKQNWEENTVINIVNKLKNKQLRLIIDCGLQDFFLEVNRNLHKKLVELKIEHDYIERPGGHNSQYWNNSIDYQLLFFKKGFDADLKRGI